MHTRLRRARLVAGYGSARAAIERFGWKASTYRAHENGQNKFKVSDAGAYARAYRVSASWLLFGEQGPTHPTAGVTGSDPQQIIPTRDGRRDAARESGGNNHFDLSRDPDDLSDIARRGDILRFAPALDPRALSEGDIAAIERHTDTGVYILPTRVFFRHGKTMSAPTPATQEETFIDARRLGNAIWLLRRLAL
jgi:hypothetical protein